MCVCTCVCVYIILPVLLNLSNFISMWLGTNLWEHKGMGPYKGSLLRLLSGAMVLPTFTDSYYHFFIYCSLLFTKTHLYSHHLPPLM